VTGRVANVQLATILACIGIIALSTAMGPSALRLAPAAAIVALVAVYYRRIFSWPVLVSVLLLIILFLPIRRYTIALNLPFELEPYRLYIIVLLLMWVTALLVDPRVRIARTNLEAPLIVLIGVLVASVFVNADRVYQLQLANQVVKTLALLLTWIAVLVLVSSVTLRIGDVERQLKLLVAGGAVLGVLGVVESKTGFNPFNDLAKSIPLLRLSDVPGDSTTFRAGATRAYGSAQHPIAFGAMFALLAPPALYLAYRRRTPIWIAALVLILLGSITSVSRTSVVMLLVSGLLLLVWRPETRRLLPFLLPIAVVAQLVIPGTFGTYQALFFPKHGLVAEQARGTVGQSRVESLSPALDQATQRPLLGYGYGTRITVGDDRNSFILDDEWLGTLLDAGIAGVLAWVWLFVRFVRRAGREGRRDMSDRGWLLAVLAASVASFAVGMLFYDAFSFIQVSILCFILMGLGCALLRMPRGELLPDRASALHAAPTRLSDEQRQPA